MGKKKGSAPKKDEGSQQPKHTDPLSVKGTSSKTVTPSQQQQQQQQPPTQGAWGRGPASAPSQQQQKQQPPTQGAWGRGPASAPSQQQQQQQPPTQGAWGRGPASAPSQQQQQQQPPTQGAWGRGPASAPSQQQQQQQPPTQGAWGRGPASESSQQQKFISSTTKKDSEKVESQELETYFQFAPRISAPKKSGRPITVATNHFPLIISNPNIVLCHYDVKIEPDRPKYVLRPVWKKFMSLKFPKRLAAFDGKNAFSRGPLMQEPSCSATVKIQYDSKEKEYNVTIQEVRRISFSVFMNFKEKILKSPEMKVLPEAEISVLEIILKDWACDNFVRTNQNFFPLSGKSNTETLSNKLELRFGYFQSASLGYKTYLNFDISHKAFYVERSLLDIINFFRHPRTKVLNLDGLNQFLRTVKIQYRIPNDSIIRTYRVNKLVDNALTQCFTKDTETKITVAKYFETEKKCRLQYPDLPLLWVGPTQKSIYLPMEFCRIAPDQVYDGITDQFEKRQMVKLSTYNAKVRQDKINSLIHLIDFNNQPLMKEFELKISEEMEKVTGRVLNAPDLKTSRNIQVSKGVWRINNFLEPAKLRKWCILNLDKSVRNENIICFQNMIKSKGNEMGIEILDPIKAPIQGDSSFAGLKKTFSQLKDMEMVLVIISEDKGVYSRVKVITETQEGILTQCVRGRTALQDPGKLQSTVQNILLKINVKLGGKNYCLDDRSIPSCMEGYVMVIGADVTHSNPGAKIPSVAAVTVSCDPAAFQYSGSIKIQPKGEVIKDMHEIISHHVKRFYEIRKRYPDKIIFFRDGVSEGELPIVFKEELSAVSNACSKYCKPKITFIVVQKRHHTRFFPTRQQDESDKHFNVPVGTCVDSEIVHPRDLDFYLVSHASLLGCARPTRYRVIYDDNKLTDDEIERLSYYLCHLFSRCTRSVSYPSPTYNAHLAAARVRAYLEGLNLKGEDDLETIQRKMPDLISKKFPMFFV